MFTFQIDEKIDLIFLHESFAADYLELVEKNREYLGEWLPFPHVNKQVDDYKTFIRKSLHDYADGKSMFCGVRYEGRLIGTCGFNNIDKSLKKVEVGYWIAAEHQGKGIVTKVCRKLVDVAFTTFSMEKVEIAVATGNVKSRKVPERLGFDLEGIITRAEEMNGKILDHAKYGLLKNKKPSASA
jgi:ribosomal-protein-serine acetyltransferase